MIKGRLRTFRFQKWKIKVKFKHIRKVSKSLIAYEKINRMIDFVNLMLNCYIEVFIKLNIWLPGVRTQFVLFVLNFNRYSRTFSVY